MITLATRDPAHAPAPSAATTVTTGTRLASVDVLRGVVMVLMALDHTRDYFGDLAADPTDPVRSGTALFLTRWITHFCAPVFFLLAGTGARLSLAQASRAAVSRFLLLRGAWLVLLELTLLRAAWQFNVDYHVTLLNVIWALGWSMIALAALVWLPTRAVAAIGIGMIALHDLADGIAPAALGPLAPLWTVLHAPGFLLNAPGRAVFVAYPLVPWIGVMAAGYALGAALEWPAERRRAFLLRAGLACVAAFVALRAANAYGDPASWTRHASAVSTLLSFVDTTKYPPSLLFLLMTLGPALLALRALDGRPAPRLLRPAVVFGRVPFFYFVAHVLLLHLLAVAASLARYGTAAPMLASPTLDRFPITQPPGWPAPLPVVWALWIAVVVALYPACRWFAGLKARRRDVAWLRFL